MRGKFFRHVIGGFAIGLALGAAAMVAMVWWVMPGTVTVPWGLAFAGLAEAGFIGSAIGLATFLRAILKIDNDTPSGGLGSDIKANDAPLPKPKDAPTATALPA